MNPIETAEIRELIIAKIASILGSVYDEPAQGVTPDTVSAWLAFKSEPRLNELRLALERIERDEYGVCIFCKGRISLTVLRQAPTAHFCDSCASILRHRTEANAQHSSARNP